MAYAKPELLPLGSARAIVLDTNSDSTACYAENAVGVGSFLQESW